jgi:hypothetical protein
MGYLVSEKDAKTNREVFEMSVEVIKNGRVVASSRNLEVISRYQRGYSIYVKSVSISKLPNGEGHLHLIYSDGATVDTNFADYTVLKQWCENKRIFPKVRQTQYVKRFLK